MSAPELTLTAADEAVVGELFKHVLKSNWEARVFHRLLSTNEGDAAKLSEDDFKLLEFLAYGTRDADQIERIARTSPRYRPRWENKWGGRTWVAQSIQNA